MVFTGDKIQWSLAKDEAAVKLDGSHYFFSLRVPANGLPENEDDDDDENSVHERVQFDVLRARKRNEEVKKLGS